MMHPICQTAVLLIVSRPTEVLCSIACKLSTLPEGQVVGTGTVLASAQVQSLIAEDCGVCSAMESPTCLMVLLMYTPGPPIRCQRLRSRWRVRSSGHPLVQCFHQWPFLCHAPEARRLYSRKGFQAHHARAHHGGTSVLSVHI